MKKYSAIPAHYRQVTTGTIRKGDLKKSAFGGSIRKVSGSIGKSVTSGTSTVWRRNHVAIKPETVKAQKRVAAVEKNPLVTFNYPIGKEPWNQKTRTVRVISATPKYIVGLEVTDKNRFKKFLASKASSLKLTEYSTGSMP